MNIHFYKDIFKNNHQKEDINFYKDFFAKELILRDYLAIERTILVNESTFLAYIRTSLTIMVVGVTIITLSESYRVFQYLGVTLVISGLFIFFLGSVRTIQMRNKINKFLKKRKKIEDENLG